MEGQFNEALLIVSSFFIVFLFIWINSLRYFFNYRNLFGLIKAITILSFGAFYIKTDQRNHKCLSYLVPYTQFQAFPINDPCHVAIINSVSSWIMVKSDIYS